MTPYFYILKFNQGYYVGCQYGTKSDPNNLLKTYFTSSSYVKELIREGNTPSIKRVIVRDDAREYEQKYLSKMFSKLGLEKFAQLFINRNLAPGILHTAVVREKMSLSIKEAWKISGRKFSGENNGFYGKSHSTETKKHLSEMKKQFYISGGEHPRGMKNKKHSKETKKKISDNNPKTHLGCFGEDHPVGGTKWWNNGTEHKRATESPGSDWVEGRIFKQRKRKIHEQT